MRQITEVTAELWVLLKFYFMSSLYYYVKLVIGGFRLKWGQAILVFIKSRYTEKVGVLSIARPNVSPWKPLVIENIGSTQTFKISTCISTQSLSLFIMLISLLQRPRHVSIRPPTARSKGLSTQYSIRLCCKTLFTFSLMDLCIKIWEEIGPSSSVAAPKAIAFCGLHPKHV